MAIKIVVPELGESVVEATVGRWLKHEGEQVAAGETIVELETDKVDLEVGAERVGILAHIDKVEGTDVKIGDVLGTIETETENVPATEQTTAAPPPPTVRRDLNPPSPSTTPEATPPTPSQATIQPTPQDGDKITPVARRLAEERGVNIEQIAGTGPGGRVTKQDVEAFLEKQQAPAKPAPEPQPTIRREPKPPPPSTPPAPAPAATPAPAAGTSRAGDREERVRMSRRRRTIAERLLQASQSTAMLTTFNEVDMTAVMEIRRRRRESFKEEHGVGLGFTSFFVRASIGALKAFPALNAEIQGDEIVYKHYYDIGIAVGAAEGLVVPVLRDADRMSFGEIEQRVKAFAEKADKGTLSIDDLRGGTFTITNGGVFGSLMSTPILNPPQVAILGLHKIEERPIAVESQVVIHPMMYVAVSYDHRIVDGREAVQFLVRIKKLIEDPEELLLEG